MTDRNKRLTDSVSMPCLTYTRYAWPHRDFREDVLRCRIGCCVKTVHVAIYSQAGLNESPKGRTKVALNKGDLLIQVRSHCILIQGTKKRWQVNHFALRTL